MSTEWSGREIFLLIFSELQEKKPVICCGDLNVAHQEIDLKNPKTNRKNAGFTDEERACFTKVLESGFIDTFRYFYPDQEGIYSWWSYRFKAREKNAGWRIDYFIVSPALKDKLQDASIHTEIMGSDHCPIELDMESVLRVGIQEGEKDYVRSKQAFGARRQSDAAWCHKSFRGNEFCGGGSL